MLRFRTATPMADWRTFKFTMLAAGPWTEGLIYKVEDTVGMLFLPIKYGSQGEKLAKTILITEEGVLVYHIEKVMANKVVGTGFACLPGDKLYWSGVQGSAVTPVYQSGYYWIGICVFPAAESDPTVMMDLKSDKASLTHPL